ncbi:MAG: DUF2185 domain-containing protein [Gordonia sp. (in: high G+C Gram-positive bacteria)]|uniref:DUF2185 domain-containing protein n=1 Tax=Gordonia sp. (in: high G+C Gram-positive bacteria) TaxID=84139 RepID=UPI0039E45AAB
MPSNEFIRNAGACLATTNVLERRGQVRWMVRENSQDPADNGWRIMSHIDTEEYLNSDGCWRIVDFNDVCELEPALIEMWPLPVGSDLQLVRDEAGTRIVDTASGRQVIPEPPKSGPIRRTRTRAAAPGPHPYEIAKREDAIASETCSTFDAIPGWDLALVTATFASNASAPTTTCQLFNVGHDEPDLERWFGTGSLPPGMPLVNEPQLSPELVNHIAAHREAMPDDQGRMWSTMLLAVQRQDSFYFFACRYR